MAQLKPEDFKIDISHKMSFKYILAKQFDHNSRVKRLVITDNNIPLNFTGNELVTLSLSINGDNYSNTTCQFGEDNFPYITFTESMLSKVGNVDSELKIWDHENGTVTTTFTFQISIEKSILNHDRLVESSEFDILNGLIIQAISIPDLIKQFNLSQDTINSFINQITNEIKTYQETFTSLSSEAQGLIDDVQAFLESVTAAESGRVTAENLRVQAENKRQTDTTNAISNIEKRTDTAILAMKTQTTDAVASMEKKIDTVIENAENAINETKVATQNTKKAISDAETATKETNEAIVNATNEALFAREQGEAARDAVSALHYELLDMDGGDAFTEQNEYTDDYDGGGA